MFFLLSGEGPTDIGACRSQAASCTGTNLRPGPMAGFVEQIVERQTRVRVLAVGNFEFIPKVELGRVAKEVQPPARSRRLPGKRGVLRETGYFYKSANALGLIAKKHDEEKPVIAVLFRDNDDRAEVSDAVWQDKWNSMIDGFGDAECDTGVPMIPKPTSEAWLLCALKTNPYQGCARLESRTASPSSRNPLKKELAERLRQFQLRLGSLGEELYELVHDGIIDAEKIDMPSFKAFRDRLIEVIK